MVHRILVIGCLALALPGCGGANAPRLEAWEAGAFQPRGFETCTVTGQRDGAVTHAQVRIALDEGELRVELEIAYNPTPVLASGRWQLGEFGGTVVAESLKFLGGQGEGPSLGGRFRLEDVGRPRYRVTLPLKPLR
ncbi:MAG TPA: hypothetical protein VFX92_12230 [Candidatus Krumholzibacteria bacterium]|nr:hypothetical protein [Candidatus Krumholzibacteria bacterium]